MTITLEEPRQLRVRLSREELAEYGLSFNKLQYDRPETRAMLNSLLLCALDSTDFKLEPGKMLIEAFPYKNGGCDIYFTITSLAHPPKKTPDGSHFYEFENTNDMLEGITKAYLCCDNIADSSLYSMGDKFRLEIQNESPAQEMILSEYSRPLGGSRALRLHTMEHWEHLCPRNALSRIGRAMKDTAEN